MGCAAADYDNDGDVDIYVTNYGPNRLFRNDGHGCFEDVADQAGCQSNRYSTGAAFSDFDRDGWLDLVVSDYLDLHSLDNKSPETLHSQWRGFTVYTGPRSYKPQGMSLFHNQGDGTFEDVTVRSKIAEAPPAFSFTCLWADVNGDGYPDLYVANDSMPSYLFINNRDGTFNETGLGAGVAYSEDGAEMASMGADYGDVNGDGEWDLTVTNFSEEPFSILLGKGDGTFDDATFISGVGNLTYSSLGWGVQWIDVDNDGDEDLFFCNGHVYPEADHPDLDTSFAQIPQLFENDGKAHFTLVREGLGPDFYRPRIGRGCVSGDLDRDGDVDLVLNNLGSAPSVLINEGGNQNHWLQVELEGRQSNRSAIGAVVKLYSGEIRSMKEVRSGASFISQNSLVLHFGLAKEAEAETVEVAWPSGASSRLEHVKADQRIRVVEPEK